jgi:AcrR family transcriptional regulator
MAHIQMSVQDDGEPPRRTSPRRSANSNRTRGSARRRQLLDVATRLFYERGYGRTTLQDIADEMGFTKAAIYYYSKNKEELLLDIYEEIVLPATERAREIAAGPESGADRFTELITEHLRTFLANLHVNAVFDVQSNALSPTAKRKVQTWGRDYGTILRDVYVEGVKDGSLRDLPPAIVVNSILGTCNSVHRWLNPNGSIGVDEVLDTVVSILDTGYRA